MLIARFKPLVLTGVIAALSSQTLIAAPVVVPKPLAPTNAAEFGRYVARAGDYAIASSTQATAMQGNSGCLGSATMSCFQGLVTVYKGNSTQPERIYQFPGQYGYATPSNPADWVNYPIATDPSANFFLQAGSQVAIANDWLAFSTGKGMNWAKSNKIFLVGKTNGQWDSCPTTNGVVDCNAASEPLSLTPSVYNTKPLKEVPNGDSFALSDRHLAVVHGTVISLYSYSPLSNIWFYSGTLNPLDKAGAPFYIDQLHSNIALDGNHLAVRVSGRGFNYELQIYTFDWDARKWVKTDTVGAGGSNWAHQFAMKDNVLVIASNDNAENSDPTLGHTGGVFFYKVDANNRAVYQGGHQVSTLTTGLAVANGVAVRKNSYIGEEMATTYNFNASQNSWQPYGKIYSYDFPRGSDVGANLALPVWMNDFDVSNGVITSGFVGQNVAGVPLVGTLFVQPVADTAANRSCLVAANKVTNCEFNSASQGWGVASYNGAYATSNYNQQSLNIQVYNSGSEPWHVQARTWVSVPTAGNYTLRFRAKKADVGAYDRPIQFSLGHNGAGDNNWTSYASRSVPVTKEWQTFTYSLKNVPVDYNAVLDFNLGKSTIAAGNPNEDAISIDSVILTKD